MSSAVYQGVWWDHATGKLILTLDSKASGFLTAAVVTWINICAAATWPICRYAFYSIRQNMAASHDVFHHQKQVMLRNSSGATSAIGQLLGLAYGWRSSRVHAAGRVALYALACLAIWVLWLLCGLFAPYIHTKTDSSVLLKESPHCGFIASPSITDLPKEIYLNITAGQVASVTAAQAYVDRCYNNLDNTTMGFSCDELPRRSLGYTYADVSCPFGVNGDACRTINSSVIRFDTGMLDSNLDFGINSHDSNRVLYRRSSTCAPILGGRFAEAYNTTGTPDANTTIPGTTYGRYYFGPYLGNNYTLEISLFQRLFPLPYYLSSLMYVPGLNESLQDQAQDWAMNRTLYSANDSDVILAYLEPNGVSYPAPVYDPVFAAGIDPDEVVQYTFDGVSEASYQPHTIVSFIACTEQHQICVPDRDYCTHLGPNLLAPRELQMVKNLTLEQATTAGRMMLAAGASSINAAPSLGGASILKASQTLFLSNQQAYLPMDQWRKEVTNWFTIGLAMMQTNMLTWATGPSNPTLYAYEQLYPGQRQHGCGIQRVRDGNGSANYDMIALIILIVVGAFLIALGLVFEQLVAYIARRRTAWKHKHAQWISDGLWQVQRQALEARGVRGWDHTGSDVPISLEHVDSTAELELVNEVEHDNDQLHDPQKQQTHVRLLHTPKH